LLSFLGAVAGSGLTREADCRRGPDGSWWAAVALARDPAAEHVWAAGGRPFVRDGDRWTALLASGGTAPHGEPGANLDVRDWAEARLDAILAEIPLAAARPMPRAELDVMTPGPLGRWVLRRALALGVSVGLVAARRRPLHGPGPEGGVLLLHLRARSETIPQALVHAIADLPDTIVGQPTGPEGRRLLVDVRCRALLPTALLGGLIAEDEVWILGAPDVGHWRLRPEGSEIDGSLLAEPPATPITPAPSSAGAKLPAPIPVSLVRSRSGNSRVDAVLLDDKELEWVRPFLAGRPSGEVAFLLPGPDVYLLTAPGGLPESLPFGIPLVHAGPRGLYLELGLDFFPALPESAREHAFGLDDRSAVAVVEGGAYRFDAEQTVPAWGRPGPGGPRWPRFGRPTPPGPDLPGPPRGRGQAGPASRGPPAGPPPERSRPVAVAQGRPAR
jgi:hypothetical protein